MSSRRQFISLLGGTAAAWPLAARAQQPAMPVIGFLSGRGSRDSVGSLAAFQKGLNDAGFIEGKNVAIEYRWAEGHYERLPAMATDLVHRHVAVIVAATNFAAKAAKAATTAIPIVFTTGDDPITTGLVPNLNRPTDNVTGATLMAGALPAKRLELLHELVPATNTVGMLVNPKGANADLDPRAVLEAAGQLGIHARVFRASTDRDIDMAFSISSPGTFRIYEHANIFGRWQQLVQQFEALSRQRTRHQGGARHIVCRSIQVGHQSCRDRVARHSGVCRSGRADVLWTKHRGPISSRCRLC